MKTNPPFQVSFANLVHHLVKQAMCRNSRVGNARPGVRGGGPRLRTLARSSEDQKRWQESARAPLPKRGSPFSRHTPPQKSFATHLIRDQIQQIGKRKVFCGQLLQGCDSASPHQRRQDSAAGSNERTARVGEEKRLLSATAGD